jgi:hypothetical protein
MVFSFIRKTLDVIKSCDNIPRLSFTIYVIYLGKSCLPRRRFLHQNAINEFAYFEERETRGGGGGME